MAATAPITVEQAAAILGVSVTTVKRRIRAGTIRAERASRAQGAVWLVYLPAAATRAAKERPPAASVAATTAVTPTATAEAMVSLIQTTIGTVLGPLVGQLDAQRQTVERQAGRIAELEREVGTLTERLSAQDRQNSALDARTAAQAQDSTTTPGSVFGRLSRSSCSWPCSWPGRSWWDASGRPESDRSKGEHNRVRGGVRDERAAQVSDHPLCHRRF